MRSLFSRVSVHLACMGKEMVWNEEDVVMKSNGTMNASSPDAKPFLREYLADLGSFYLMILGLVAIIVMLKAPSGLWGFMKSKFDIQLFPLSYRVSGNSPKESTNGKKI